MQLNAFRKKHYLQEAIVNITDNYPHYQTIRDTKPAIVQYSTPVIKHLNYEPFCFVADSNSQLYFIDTAANKVIINNPKLLSSFIASAGGVKLIGGGPV